jgi:hypothetical protein
VRLFDIRVNVEALAAASTRCHTDADRAALLNGLLCGANGGSSADGAPARWYEGFAIGYEGHSKAVACSLRQSEKAKIGVLKRQPQTSHGSATAQAAAKATAQPQTKEPNINQETNSSPDKSGMDGFDAWWDAYGKKTGKAVAVKLWRKLSPADREAAMAATPAYVAWKSDVQYRKDPERFLKHRLWEDEIPQAHTPADSKDDPSYDHFMDGAITDPAIIRERLGFTS